MIQKLLVAGLLSQMFIFATAKADDSGFPYSGADAAFQTATLPTAAQLTGKWYVIGLAENPNVTTDLEGYWPDGKFQMPGWAGYFFQRATVTTGTDAFGTPSVSWDEQRIGAETGDVYSTFTSVGAFSNTGVALTFEATDLVCGAAEECRFVAAQSMLLCRMMVTDTRPSCRQDSANNTQVIYFGYQQLNPAP
jgi:hypothetical protein